MVKVMKIMAISFKRSELWRVTQTQGRRTFLNCNFTWMPFVQKPLVLEVTEKWSVCDTGNFVLPPIREQPSLFQGEISKQNKTKQNKTAAVSHWSGKISCVVMRVKAKSIFLGTATVSAKLSWAELNSPGNAG